MTATENSAPFSFVEAEEVGVILLADLVAGQDDDVLRVIAVDEADVLVDGVCRALYQSVPLACSYGGRVWTPPYRRSRSQGWPLPMYSFSFWGWYCVAMPTVSMLELTQLDSGKSTMRYLPPKDTAGFAVFCVSAYKRDPRPPARIIATISFAIAIFSPLTFPYIWWKWFNNVGRSVCLIFRPYPPSWRGACGRAFQPAPLPFLPWAYGPVLQEPFLPQVQLLPSVCTAALCRGFFSRRCGLFCLRFAALCGCLFLSLFGLCGLGSLLGRSLFRVLLLGGLAGALCRHLEVEHAHGGQRDGDALLEAVERLLLGADSLVVDPASRRTPRRRCSGSPCRCRSSVRPA